MGLPSPASRSMRYPGILAPGDGDGMRMGLAGICVALAGMAAVAYWPMAGRAPSWQGSALKTASTALLALAASLAGGNLWLTSGLALGALGDFALSRPGGRAFRAGLFAFLLGHLACVALFLTHGDSLPARPLLWPGIAATLALGLFCAFMARRLWPAAGALRGPVMAYVVVIAAMGFAVLTLPPPHPGQGAALLFIASDAVLAAQLFLWPAGHKARAAAPFAVWPLYWLAQALFLGSFAFQIAP